MNPAANSGASSGLPIHGDRDTRAGMDRRPGRPNLPTPPERWRHVRTGIVSAVVYVARDASYLYTSESGVAWPMDMFLARWERT